MWKISRSLWTPGPGMLRWQNTQSVQLQCALKVCHKTIWNCFIVVSKFDETEHCFCSLATFKCIYKLQYPDHPKNFARVFGAPAKSGAALRVRSGLIFRSGAPTALRASNPERRSDQRSDPGALALLLRSSKRVKLIKQMKNERFNFVSLQPPIIWAQVLGYLKLVSPPFKTIKAFFQVVTAKVFQMTPASKP